MKILQKLKNLFAPKPKTQYWAHTRTYTITSHTKETLDRIERFFAFLHYNGGHSGIFGMDFDGDGPDRVRISPAPPKDARGWNDFSLVNTGQTFEIAFSSCYRSFPRDHSKHFYEAKGRKLFKVMPDGTRELRKDCSGEDLSRI